MASTVDTPLHTTPRPEPVDPVHAGLAAAPVAALVLVPTGEGVPAIAGSLRRGPAQILAHLCALGGPPDVLPGVYRPTVAGESVLEMAAHVAAEVARLVEQGQVPLVVGGDHTAALGSVRGVRCGLLARTGRDVPLFVLWLDAHPDLNTPETSPSGNPHGMVLAGLLGWGPLAVPGAPALAPERVALAGVRDADPGEQAFLDTHPEMVQWDVSLLRDDAWMPPLDALLARVARSGGRLYVTLDLDVFDPAAAPGVAVPVSGGAHPSAVLGLLGRAAASGLLAGADVVELDPSADRGGRTARLAAAAVKTLAGAVSRDRAVPATRAV